jgi:hypothetical protein
MSCSQESLLQLRDGRKLVLDDFDGRPQCEERYDPTEEEWSDYGAMMAEMEDRREQMELWRREQAHRARSAVCVVRGIAASLAGRGLDDTAGRLFDACTDLESLLRQFA